MRKTRLSIRYTPFLSWYTWSLVLNLCLWPLFKMKQCVLWTADHKLFLTLNVSGSITEWFLLLTFIWGGEMRIYLRSWGGESVSKTHVADFFYFFLSFSSCYPADVVCDSFGGPETAGLDHCEGKCWKPVSRALYVIFFLDQLDQIFML